MQVWLNGRLIPGDQAAISVADRGFTLGDGLFETIRVVNGRLIRRDAHLDRLAQGAALLRLPPPDRDMLAQALAQMVAANHMVQGSLRLTVSRGAGQRGLLPPDPANPVQVITAASGPGLTAPLRAVVAQSVRRNAHSPLSRCKTISTLDTVLARMEAADQGADDAVMLNGDGKVTETTIANIFVVRDNRVLTPPVADGVLPGVRRADVLAQGMAEEGTLSLDDLLMADEIFVTNALSVRPLIALSGTAIGGGRVGPVTQKLINQFKEE